MHYQKHVLGFIEQLRIGNVTPDDAIKMETEFVFADPYAEDPVRPNLDFLHTTEKPFCGEPLLRRIGETFYTPNDLHYVRLHMPVAHVDPKEWKVVVTGNGVKEVELNLKDIQTKFQHHTLACTLQCAGNRREEFQDVGGKSVFISPQWRVAAFSNAKYKGVYLRDVLKHAGMDVDKMYAAEKQDPKLNHVQFEGTDVTEDGMTYGVSIPFTKAVDPRGDVMLVWEMNDEPLPLDHGGPVRMLCPGHVGNKSCKFLEKIIVSDIESNRPWHQKSYRNFAPNYSFEEHLSKWHLFTKHELELAPITQLMPVQSLITQPAPGSVVGAKGMDSLYIRGCSWSGNGVGMARVDVSADGGDQWLPADFLPKPADVVEREVWQRKWSWFQFEKKIPLTQQQKDALKRGEVVKMDLVSKGVDNQFNVQPESVLPYYNARGVVINSWYHVPITLDHNMASGKEEEVTGEDHLNPPSGGHFLREWNEHGWTEPIAKWHEDIMRQSGKGKK
jgi:sulfite oxidase